MTLVISIVITTIYAVVIRLRRGFSWREIAARLGLAAGEARYYAWASGFAILGIASFYLIFQSVPEGLINDENYAFHRFVGQTLSTGSIFPVLIFAFLETGLGEELLFRGLIGGALGRRMPLWKANLIQAILFTLPHLLLLTIALGLWRAAIMFPFVFGSLAGWLRLKSGSIFPGWMMHGISNAFAAIAVMGGRPSIVMLQLAQQWAN